MLRIAICEDEEVHIKILEKAIKIWSKSRNIPISIKTFPNGESFLFHWEDEKFDLIMLDIQMGELTGVETAEKIRMEDEEVGIIFVTGREEYALKGYGVGAINYFLKPANEEEVAISMDKFYRNFIKDREKSSTLNLVNGKEVRKIKFNDIIYCVVFSHYTDIVTTSETISWKKKISELEIELPSDSFIRCHRSYLVNVKRIEQVLKDELVIEGGVSIPIARGKRDYVLENFMRVI